MNKIETIEEAIRIFNEAKWRGRDDWNLPWHEIHPDDAIALAQGIVDAKELEALRIAIAPFVAVARAVEDSNQLDVGSSTDRWAFSYSTKEYLTLLAAYEGDNA